MNYPKTKEEFIKDYLKMRYFTIENWDEIYNAGILKKVSKKDYIESAKAVNEALIECLENDIDILKYFFSPASQFCIDKFAEAEIDYITPGVRGLGRASTYFPRFGGFYSKFLRKLLNTELKTINNIVLDIIKYGYYTGIFWELACERKLKNLKFLNNENLFQQWIPQIYVTSFENNSSVSPFVDQSTWDGLFYFCIKLAKETNFPKKFLKLKNAQKEKLGLIITKYIEAGFILRFLENK